MDFITLSINVPFSWNPPPILQNATPHENAIILETGTHIIIASRSESAGITNEELKKTLKMQTDSRLSEMKKEYDREIEQLNNSIQILRKNLELERNKAEIAITTKRNLEEQQSESIKHAITDYKGMLENLNNEMRLLRLKSEQEKDALITRFVEESRRDREKEQDERTKLINTLGQLGLTLFTIILNGLTAKAVPITIKRSHLLNISSKKFIT
jgi:Fe2+ transport system protein B